MEFYHRHTDVLDHPQLLAAGFWASVVFTSLCDVTAARNFGGHLPAAYLEPSWLRRTMNLTPMDVPGGDPEATIREAMSRLFVTKLLVRDTDGGGGATVDGWERRQPKFAMTAAERKRKQRESEKLSRNAVTGVTVTNVTGVEEKRREEKKISAPPVADTHKPVSDGDQKSKEPVAQKQRMPSNQERWYAWAMAERMLRFPDAGPDKVLPSKVINAKLMEPLRVAGDFNLKTGWRRYLASDFARNECSPQGAFAPFAANWQRHTPLGTAAAGVQPGTLRDRSGRNGAAGIDDQDPTLFDPQPEVKR